MELTRTYYPFTVTPSTPLDVTVTAGHPVEHGTTALPFKAKGELAAGQTARFTESFVLNISGRSDIEVVPPEPEPVAPPDLIPTPTEPYTVPTESEMRAGGLTAVEGQERPE